MDDMRNTSAPLYGKAEPATTKTTMSVREMRQLLGLGKTDSYWLLHKNLFEVILINEKGVSLFPALRNGIPIRSNIIRSMAHHRARNFANGPIPFLTPPRY